MQNPAYSYISPVGYNESSGCGYCKGRRGTGQSRTQSKRFSYYAKSSSMSVDLYQDLLDRCWRRSGTLLYRPNQKESCCPHYTIRLNSAGFHPSRDQRKAANRFNKYVMGEDYLQAAASLYPRSQAEAKKRAIEFNLAERVHEAEACQLKTPPDPAYHFEVTLEPDNFTEEKYKVFENYQRLIHKETPDEISRRGFRRFLCSSPLRREIVRTLDGTEKKLGSYHQMYRLDGKLVAIGVLDLLPHCVSSVYFLYDESVNKYSFGKLGALREIALAQEGGYTWWYPGFYIHSCPKMRYKIEYSPQYVLDPETLSWDLLDKDALAIFDKKDYVSLSRERRISGKVEGVSENETKDNRTQEDMDVNGKSDGGGSCLSLFDSNMPGIPSRGKMHSVDLDHVRFCLDLGGNTFQTSDLVGWAQQSIDEDGSLRAGIAEFVAATGPDLVPKICLDFSRAR